MRNSYKFEQEQYAWISFDFMQIKLSENGMGSTKLFNFSCNSPANCYYKCKNMWTLLIQITKTYK